MRWEHLVWASLLCFLRDWHAQLEVWRVVISERIGPFAPVAVGYQAIYNRIEQVETWTCWTFEQVRIWFHKRLARWENRSLAPFATQVLIADASTLERIGRDVPWLRQMTKGSSNLLGGQISALFERVSSNGCVSNGGATRVTIARAISSPWWNRCRQERCCSLTEDLQLSLL